MNVPDDPSLALIARFVVNDIENISLSERSFLDDQVNRICEITKDVPENNQQEVVLEWIQEHAEQYRDQWSKKAFNRLLLDRRCVDCPLIHSGPEPYCVIHRNWVKLLNDYVSGHISSDTYINETLQLLNSCKNNLKISTFSSIEQPA